MSSSIINWVNDHLHDILGLSDQEVARYLVRLVETKSSKEEVASELRNEIGPDIGIENFISDLWTKVRGKLYKFYLYAKLSNILQSF